MQYTSIIFWLQLYWWIQSHLYIHTYIHMCTCTSQSCRSQEDKMLIEIDSNGLGIICNMLLFCVLCFLLCVCDVSLLCFMLYAPCDSSSVPSAWLGYRCRCWECRRGSRQVKWFAWHVRHRYTSSSQMTLMCHKLYDLLQTKSNRNFTHGLLNIVKWSVCVCVCVCVCACLPCVCAFSSLRQDQISEHVQR